MKTATLVRTETGDEGTFGMLTADDFVCVTIELPWRDNKTEISCIPDGDYTCNWRLSPKHGYCYHVDDVFGRTDVEIHSANWAGDVLSNKRCQLQGCIAPGRSTGVLDGQKAVLESRDALTAFNAAMARESFKLSISWAKGIKP